MLFKKTTTFLDNPRINNFSYFGKVMRKPEFYKGKVKGKIVIMPGP